MNDIDPIEFGEVRQSVRALTEQVVELNRKVDELMALANKSRGGLWALVTLSGGVGGVVGWLSHLFTNSGGPR